MLSTSSGPVAGLLDPVIESLTKTAVSTATAQAQPVIDDIERRVKGIMVPVIALLAGNVLISLLTYRAVTRSQKNLSGARRR